MKTAIPGAVPASPEPLSDRELVQRVAGGDVREALAAKSGDGKAGDVRILNTAVAAELEAVAAYQVGAESNLLQKPALDLAVQFQGHHKAHADLLEKTIRKLGGKPASAKAKYSFPVETLKSQLDVLCMT
jgi:Ferritin-like domain